MFSTVFISKKKTQINKISIQEECIKMRKHDIILKLCFVKEKSDKHKNNLKGGNKYKMFWSTGED